MLPEAGIAEWLEQRAHALADKFEAVGPDTPCWTWSDNQVSGFWARRSAHETVVHGWDGCNAAGRPSVIEAPVAADGIDEYLKIVPMGFWSAKPTGNHERIQFVTSDAPDAWVVALDDTGMHVTRGEDSRDVVVRAGAADLLLFLMGRLPVEAVVINGDDSVVLRWHEQVHF